VWGLEDPKDASDLQKPGKISYAWQLYELIHRVYTMSLQLL